MISRQARIVKLGCRFFVKRKMMQRKDPPLVAIAKLRRLIARIAPYNRRITRKLAVAEITAPVRGEWLGERPSSGDAALLYVHGGAFVACSPLTHRRLTTALVRASAVPAFVVDYRLAPEHRFPSALDDVVAAFDYLVSCGVPPERIVLVGDSAGGGLVLSAGLVLARRGPGRVPGGIIAYSPWADLLATGDSIRTNSERDDMLVGDGAVESARHYAPNDDDLRDPLASPLYGELGGFPPLLLFASESEILRDDSIRFAARARAAGVDVELILEPEMPHVWPIFNDVMPEARRAIERSARFIVDRSRALTPPARRLQV